MPLVQTLAGHYQQHLVVNDALQRKLVWRFTAANVGLVLALQVIKPQQGAFILLTCGSAGSELGMNEGSFAYGLTGAVSRDCARFNIYPHAFYPTLRTLRIVLMQHLDMYFDGSFKTSSKGPRKRHAR